MLKKLGILMLGFFVLSACGDKKPESATSSPGEPTTQTVAKSTEIVEKNETETETEYVDPVQVFNKKSRKYQVKEVVGAEFDRCAPYELQTKEGKKVQMPKAITENFLCFDESLLPYNDQYIVYQTNNEWRLYDLDSQKDLSLFKAFDDIHSENQGWSPDGKQIVFGCIAFEENQAKKVGYKGLSRIIAIQLNDNKSAVVSKKKYDRNFHYLPVEGDMIPTKSLKFTSNTAISYDEKGNDPEDLSKTGAAQSINLTDASEETK